MKAIGISDVLELPVTERLKLFENIQRAELDRRLEEYEKNPEDGSPWLEVKARILKRSEA